MPNYSENPFKPFAESPSVGEVLKDPVGSYLKRHPSEKAAKPETAFGLDSVSPEHRAEILGGAYRELLDEKKTDACKLAFVSALYSIMVWEN